MILIFINMFVSYLCWYKINASDGEFMTSGDCESIISWNCMVLHRIAFDLIS